LISTSAAGAAEVFARFSWRTPADEPREYLLSAIGDLMDDPEASRHLLDTKEAGNCVLRGNVRAMTPEALGERVGWFLRSVSVYAARTEAVLETRAARTADPIVSPVGVVGDLASILAKAGIPSRCEEVWTPLPPDAACGLGTGGMEESIQALLLDHPQWTVVSVLEAR
jgi:hypothetical protein